MNTLVKRTMRKNDEEWMMNIPQDYTEKLIYKTLLDDIVKNREYQKSSILIIDKVSD